MDQIKLWKIISEFIGPLCLIISVLVGYNFYLRAVKAENSVNNIVTYISSEINIDTFNSYVEMRETIDSMLYVQATTEVDSIIEKNIEEIFKPIYKDSEKLLLTNNK